MAMRALHEPSVDDQSAADTSRYDHAEEVTLAAARAEPPFTERHGLRVVVDDARMAE